jgi:hypothetical protein
MPADWMAALPGFYRNDPYLTDLLPLLRARRDGAPDPHTPPRAFARARFFFIDAQEHVWSTTDASRPRLFLPQGALRDALLNQLHEDLGHPSAQRLHDMLVQQYYVPDAAAVVRTIVGACLRCIQSRPMTTAIGMDANYDQPLHPHHTGSIDIATGLPPAGALEFDSILVVRCDLTGYQTLIPVRTDYTSDDYITALEDRFFRDNGYPRVLKADGQTALTSHAMVKYLRENGCTLRVSTPEHHQATAENAIAQLRVHLRASVGVNPASWLHRLFAIQHLANAAPSQSGDRLSPFQRCIGRNPPWPFLGAPHVQAGMPPALQLAFTAHRLPPFQELCDTWAARRVATAVAHNAGRRQPRLRLYDHVAIPAHLSHTDIARHKDNKAAKIRPLYLAPFQLVEKAEGDNWFVKVGDKRLKFHVSVLKLVPASVAVVPTLPGQPADILWSDGLPKVREIVSRRPFGRRLQYLALFWGQHGVNGRWVFPADVNKMDRPTLHAFKPPTNGDFVTGPATRPERRQAPRAN